MSTASRPAPAEYRFLAVMGFLKNHLSSEDKAYLWYVRASGSHRGLPAGAGATHRAVEAAQASPEPLSGARVGARAQRSVGYTSRCTSIRIPRI
jgi:hypothetical protein